MTDEADNPDLGDITVPQRLRFLEADSSQAFGLFTQSGTQILESPPPQAIEALLSNNAGGRIEYFRFGVPQRGYKLEVDDSGKSEQVLTIVDWKVVEDPQVTYDISEEALNFYQTSNAIGVGGNVFVHDAVVPFLERRIVEEFKDREILGIRGTAASIDLDNEVLINGKHINSVAEVVAMGSETGEDIVAQTPFVPNGIQQEREINSRSVQWLISHAQHLRAEAIRNGQKDAAAKIFPVLLVYDRSKFQPGSARLIDDPDQRSAAILKAYILDYPLPRNT